MKFRPVHIFQFIILGLSVAMSGQDSIPEIKVSVSVRNRTINQVLEEITLQTGYYFTFNAALVPGEEKVHITLKNIPLEQALDSILGDQGFDYRKIDRNIVIYKPNKQAPLPVLPEINRSILTGQVIDKKSGKPLPYATIALHGTSIGSVSNQAGGFILKIPSNLKNPLLVVSFMGYKNKLFPIKDLDDNNLTLGLEKETIPLQEVVIRYSDPVKLLNNAIKLIPENYLQDDATMTAYYREAVRRNDHCMMFSEAVLDVAKEPYSPFSPADQVRLRKGRKMTDTSTEDTVLIKLRSGIYDSFGLDVVKNPPDFLSKDFQEYYDLDFTDIMTYNDRLVYVISFQQKSQIPDLMFRGQLYLDLETLAILSADFEYNPELIQKEPGLFLVSRSPRLRIRPVFAKYHVEYQNHEGVHYLSQVRAELELRVRKRRRWIGSRYGLTLEMAITEVIPGQHLEIDRADRVRPNTILADQSFEFDPLFWGPYNTIEPEASLIESLQRIKQNLKAQEAVTKEKD